MPSHDPPGNGDGCLRPRTPSERCYVAVFALPPQRQLSHVLKEPDQHILIVLTVCDLILEDLSSRLATVQHNGEMLLKVRTRIQT